MNKFEQLTLPRHLQWKLHGDTSVKHRLLGGARELPCGCQSTRVVNTSPGVYERKCPICKAQHAYVLEVSTYAPGCVMMRWVDAAELLKIRAAGLYV